MQEASRTSYLHNGWPEDSVLLCSFLMTLMPQLSLPLQAAASIAFAVLAPPSSFAVVVPPDAASSSDSDTLRQQQGCGVCGEQERAQGPPNTAVSSSSVPYSPECPTSTSPETVVAAPPPPKVSVSGRYIEDCKLSQPSSEARDPRAAEALWYVTQELLAEKLLGQPPRKEGEWQPEQAGTVVEMVGQTVPNSKSDQ